MIVGWFVVLAAVCVAAVPVAVVVLVLRLRRMRSQEQRGFAVVRHADRPVITDQPATPAGGWPKEGK